MVNATKVALTGWMSCPSLNADLRQKDPPYFLEPLFKDRGFLSACVLKGRGSWRWEGREGQGPAHIF